MMLGQSLAVRLKLPTEAVPRHTTGRNRGQALSQAVHIDTKLDVRAHLQQLPGGTTQAQLHQGRKRQKNNFRIGLDTPQIRKGLIEEPVGLITAAQRDQEIPVVAVRTGRRIATGGKLWHWCIGSSHIAPHTEEIPVAPGPARPEHTHSPADPNFVAGSKR